MAQDIFISVDAGTSMIKSVAFDSDGKQLAVASAPNQYRKIAGGGVEQDLAQTWEKAVKTLAEAAAQVPGAAGRVAAVAVTGQGDGTWLIDRDGAPVGDGLLWLDVRAAGIVSEFDARGSREAAYPFTGSGLNPCNQSAQLAWLKRAQPERVQQADCAMHCKDWLYFNLTGTRATDPSEGVFTFGNYLSREYADEVLEAFDLGDCRRLLPPMVDGSQLTHPLSAGAAKAVGLAAGTPVSLGAVDVVCTALGGGACEPGGDVGCSIIGTTGMHIRMFSDAATMPLAKAASGYTMVLPGFPGAVLRMHSNMSATLNLDWLAALVAESAALLGAQADEQRSLQSLGAAAEAAPPGDVFFLPYIESGERGPFLNADARAQLSGLHSGAGLGQLARAVYEGLVFAARHCYEALGDKPQEVRLVGGGARSRVLREAFADVLGAGVRVSKWPEPGAIGAAMMAAVAVRRFADMGEACRTWVEPGLGPVHAPNTAMREHYDRLFAAYLLAVEAAPPVWGALAELRRAQSSGRPG